MFEVNGNQYELNMNTNRVKMVEAAAKTSVMGEWANNNGMFSLTTMEVCFQLCTKETGSEIFLPQSKGKEVFHQFLEEKGYPNAVKEIVEALQKDMPFLFLAN